MFRLEGIMELFGDFAVQSKRHSCRWQFCKVRRKYLSPAKVWLSRVQRLLSSLINLAERWAMSNQLPYLVHFPDLSFNLLLLLQIYSAMIDKAMQSCCFRICCCNELGAAGCKPSKDGWVSHWYIGSFVSWTVREKVQLLLQESGGVVFCCCCCCCGGGGRWRWWLPQAKLKQSGLQA